MALTGHCDLQRLANPPRGVGCQSGAVRDIEAVNRLHEAANGFLKQIGVSEAVVSEAFGDVGGQSDVRGGQTVLEVDVSAVETSNGHDFAVQIVTVVADELGHRPGFEGRLDGTQIREVSEEDTNQFVFAVPEVRKKLTFFFGS